MYATLSIWTKLHTLFNTDIFVVISEKRTRLYLVLSIVYSFLYIIKCLLFLKIKYYIDYLVHILWKIFIEIICNVYSGETVIVGIFNFKIKTKLVKFDCGF